jgi:hypothetical protein
MDKSRFDDVQKDIIEQRDKAGIDHFGREELLKKLESTNGQRRVVVSFARPDKSLSQHDIIPFFSMLKSVGQVEAMDMVIVSNGGDGLTAEKMLALCRRYCTGKFRVVVPLYAKSAATLLALGADEIVMGETSELGPIDAQVYLIQDNAEQQVSADHYLRARDDCIKKLSSDDPGEKEAAQIALSLLSPAYLKHCEDLMNFGRDFARRQLQSHMFHAEFTQDNHTWASHIDKIINNLTSTSKHLSHGRMINAEAINADQDLQHLKIFNLSEEDPYWLALTELLLRTEIVSQLNNIGKMFFSIGFNLFSA